MKEFREARLFEMHDILTAAWGRSDEDHLAKHFRNVQRHPLSDYPAKRKSQNITCLDPERTEKRSGVFRHPRHCRRHFARRTAHTGIVEEDDAVVRGQCVRYGRIPVMRVSVKCCMKSNGYLDFLPKRR